MKCLISFWTGSFNPCFFLIFQKVKYFVKFSRHFLLKLIYIYIIGDYFFSVPVFVDIKNSDDNVKEIDIFCKIF